MIHWRERRSLADTYDKSLEAWMVQKRFTKILAPLEKGEKTNECESNN